MLRFGLIYEQNCISFIPSPDCILILLKVFHESYNLGSNSRMQDKANIGDKINIPSTFHPILYLIKNLDILPSYQYHIHNYTLIKVKELD